VGHELFYEADDGGPVDIVQAPDGSLVFSEIFTGRLMQIRYNAADGQGPGGGPDSGGPAGDGPPSGMPLCGFGTPLAACGVGLLSLLRFGRGAWAGRPRRG